MLGKKVVKLETGQFVFGRSTASEELNIKRSTLYEYMKVLEKNKIITINASNKYSIVCVVKWDDYQGNNCYPDNSVATKQQQTSTNKNEKKVKKEIYNNIFTYWNSKAADTEALVKHKELSEAREKAIDKALKAIGSEKELLIVLDRFISHYEEKVRSDYPLKKRTLQDFYGQKAHGKVTLFCQEYEDEGDRYINKATQNEELKGMILL